MARHVFQWLLSNIAMTTCGFNSVFCQESEKASQIVCVCVYIPHQCLHAKLFSSFQKNFIYPRGRLSSHTPPNRYKPGNSIRQDILLKCSRPIFSNKIHFANRSPSQPPSEYDCGTTSPHTVNTVNMKSNRRQCSPTCRYSELK